MSRNVQPLKLQEEGMAEIIQDGSNGPAHGEGFMTSDAGRPVGDNQNSMTVGPRGPIVGDDFLLFEKMAHFNRERIPERVVHAKGSGAYGTLTCTNPDMKKYTSAKLFDTVGKKTTLLIRFS